MFDGGLVQWCCDDKVVVAGVAEARGFVTDDQAALAREDRVCAGGAEHVVRKGLVVEFVSRLSDVEVLEIVERVVQVFGTRIIRIKATDFFSFDLAPEVVSAVRVMRSEMPWRHVVPESDTPQLRPAQQLFVGIVLMIQRAPSRVRTVSFAREVERWVECLVEQEPVVETPRTPKIPIAETTEPESILRSETQAPIRENPIPADPVEPNPLPRRRNP